MKKLVTRFFLALFAAGLILSTTSCKKCHECAAFEKDTGVMYYYESFCAKGSGSSKEIEEWEAKFRADYAGYIIYCNITNKQ